MTKIASQWNVEYFDYFVRSNFLEDTSALAMVYDERMYLILWSGKWCDDGDEGFGNLETYLLPTSVCATLYKKWTIKYSDCVAAAATAAAVTAIGNRQQQQQRKYE